MSVSYTHLKNFDVEKAYEYCKAAITEKTLAPWSGKPAGELDRFYKEHGFIPALYEGEKETVPEVHSFEGRQTVAVTLGTAYDESVSYTHLDVYKRQVHIECISLNYQEIKGSRV